MSLISALMGWISSGLKVKESRPPEIVDASLCRRID
jgi:hypothetical protein